MAASHQAATVLLIAVLPLLLAVLSAYPNVTCCFMMLLLVFQAPLQALAGGPDSAAGLAITRLDEVVVAAMVAILLARCISRGGRWFLSCKPLVIGTLFLFVCAVSALMNRTSIAGTFLGTFMLAKCIVVYVFACTSERDRLTLTGVLRWIDVLMFLVLAGALLNLVFGEAWSEAMGTGTYGFRMGVARAHSFYRHPVYLGEVAASGVLLWVCRYSRQQDKRFFLWVPALMMAMAASLVAKPFIALACALAAAGVIDRRIRASIAGTALVMAAGGLVLWTPLSALIVGQYRAYMADFSATIRGLSYVYVVSLLREHPLLGVGPGRYGGFAATYLGSPVHDQLGLTRLLRGVGYWTVDAYWPHLLGEVGLAGALLFIILLLFAGMKAAEARDESAEPALQALAFASVLWLLQMCVSAFAAPLFEDTQSWFVTMWLLGYVFATRANKAQTAASMERLQAGQSPGVTARGMTNA